MPPRQMSNAQLQAVIYHVARVYLEVERGLRPPEQLQTFLSPSEYRRQRLEPRPERPRLGPVQMRDMGPIHFERHADDHITANLVARRGDDRWGAVVLEMRGTETGWRVSHLERLERAVQPRQEADVDSPEPAGLIERRIRMTKAERSLVGAAMTATARRIEDIGDRRTKRSKQLTTQLDRWADRLSDLDEELETLARRRELLAQAPPLGEQQDASKSLARDPEGLLGPRPPDPDSARAWDRIAGDVQSYQARWNIADGDPPLGAPPESDDQAAERRALIKRICVLRRGAAKDVEQESSPIRTLPARRDLQPGG